MTDYQKYINALRKCSKEHDNDRTFTGHVIVSDLCRDTANLLELLEQEPKTGHPQKSCDTCEHSDEIDGSNCYECVKDMRNNYSPKKIELKCNNCLNARRIISENGLHSICCLSERNAMECLMEQKNHRVPQIMVEPQESEER